MPNRPRPIADELTRPFWDAAREGRLAILRCGDCGHYLHPPRPLCDRCASSELRYEQVSGRGAVYSFTRNHQRNVAGFEEAVPYVDIVVELVDEPMLLLMSDVSADEAGWVAIGAPVEVTFEALPDGTMLPQFRPPAQPEAGG